ncbi:hypothetical protein SYNPS1DRAFT_23697 [Syncephalis pseudoplumigaleata]|uniref:Roadblock/LAMTOR2 domain-containing protein n=1 Tax=Syncephalis pseudoplumigaleata TaxID=1712513 RepID=A0A4P9YY03_9FUNG|nr:hypothetical protein SYNPS1DRAFT_23697 [Syncephalis pseudoplumigaleata]|eukprot:RKP24211.1 hypothetical protein SYNPS1DRAFT_23697 [Syncephalis pseudoplumigaleata]
MFATVLVSAHPTPADDRTVEHIHGKEPVTPSASGHGYDGVPQVIITDKKTGKQTRMMLKGPGVDVLRRSECAIDDRLLELAVEVVDSVEAVRAPVMLNRCTDRLLQQAVTGGVETALLLTRDGAVLASATASGADTSIRAAVAASVWKGYEACLHQWSSMGDNPRWLVLQCEQGRALVHPVGELLVALVAQESCELGMLKLKVAVLSGE